MRGWWKKTGGAGASKRSSNSTTQAFSTKRAISTFTWNMPRQGRTISAIRIRAVNRGPERADLTLLPTLWFRNTWSWGRTGEGYWPKGKISRAGDTAVFAEHVSLGKFRLDAEGSSELLFTENETDMERVFGVNSATAFVKDAFHRYLIEGRADVVNPHGEGTKAGALYRVTLEAGARRHHPFAPGCGRRRRSV